MDQGLWENGSSTGLLSLRNLCKGDGDPFGFGSGRIIPLEGIAEYLRNQACAILAMVRYPFGGRRNYALGIAESLHNQGLCNDETSLWGRGIMCSRDKKIPYQSSHIIPSMIPPQRNEERSN